MQTLSDPHTPTEAERLEALEADRPGLHRADASAVRDVAESLQEAYERGRRDERARRPRVSLISLAVLLAAVVGGGAIYLAVSQGSFSRGGAVVDQKLSVAGQEAQAPLRSAANQAGEALTKAGQTLKSQAGDAPPPAPAPAGQAPPP